MENDFVAHFFLVGFAVMFVVGIIAACLGLLALVLAHAKGYWDCDQKAVACFFGGLALLVASVPFGLVLGMYLFFQSA